MTDEEARKILEGVKTDLGLPQTTSAAQTFRAALEFSGLKPKGGGKVTPLQPANDPKPGR